MKSRNLIDKSNLNILLYIFISLWWKIIESINISYTEISLVGEFDFMDNFIRKEILDFLEFLYKEKKHKMKHIPLKKTNDECKHFLKALTPKNVDCEVNS